ncbi:MAG: hypothetical protein ACE5KM_06705, partial [Planctomycetaceae bacterium]
MRSRTLWAAVLCAAVLGCAMTKKEAADGPNKTAAKGDDAAYKQPEAASRRAELDAIDEVRALERHASVEAQQR